MVNSSSGNALLKVHAVRRADGGLNVLIANDDPANSYPVNLTYHDFTTSGGATVHAFANNANAITTSTLGAASAVTVGPYSLTVLAVPGSGGAVAAVPGPPGQPVVSGLASTTASATSGSATLTWKASDPGTYPIARHDVYRLDNAGRTLVAGQVGTTLGLTGLTIGASYRYDVVAVDTHGNSSLRLLPATFAVPQPPDASCAVRYAVSNSWPGGFTGAITLTNRKATAIDGWTLTFTWPTAGEAVQSGWNGTWSQTGQNVTVASWNGTIAANGGTVSIGFNRTDTGQAPAPAAFTLNGTICSAI